MNLIATYWNKLYFFNSYSFLIVFILCNSLAMGCYLLLWRIVYGLFFSTVSSKAYFLFISLWMQPFKAWQSAFQKPITRSKALVFSSLVSKKIRWRVKFKGRVIILDCSIKFMWKILLRFCQTLLICNYIWWWFGLEFA